MTGRRSGAIPLRGADADKVHDVPRASALKRRIVVLGEVNSGKTALVNAIAGAEVLAPCALGHTLHPTVVGYAAKPFVAADGLRRARTRLDAVEGAPAAGVQRLHVGSPSVVLRRAMVIDTPGLGMVDEEIDPRTVALCRTADLVIWCTPAMQAWKASEEQCWKSLPRRVRSRGVLAVTFADLVPAADLGRLMARLERDAGPVVRQIVMASACVQIAGTLEAPQAD